jgi:hypothetical protein
MALTMRQFKFSCFAVREFQVGENRRLEISSARPICLVTTHRATPAILWRYISGEQDAARTSLLLFDHDHFTDFVISGDAS